MDFLKVVVLSLLPCLWMVLPSAVLSAPIQIDISKCQSSVFFLYFHERILQSLLGDPTFSLNFWNWDNPYNVGGGSPQSAACLKVGHNFPSPYSPSTSATYDNNRSENAKGNGRSKFPDLTFSPVLPAAQQPLYNAPAETVIASNLNVMKTAMVTGGSTTTSFIGRQYRANDLKGNPSPTGGGGSLEMTAHAGAHFWTGLDPPINIDMGALPFPRVFLPPLQHRSPLARQNRQDYLDPDFLNAEFQFYDENKALRKVKVSDSLDTKNLGYVYQKADDAAWITYNSTTCSNKSYTDVIAQAPIKDAKGNYHLQAGAPFVVILNQPASNGAELFLTINGIKVNRSVNTGFDVFLSLPSPRDYLCPWKCGEYAGRFMNMASSRGRFGAHSHGKMTWAQSISAVMGNVQVPQSGPSSVVVTLLPTSNAAVQTIVFSSISIGTSSS